MARSYGNSTPYLAFMDWAAIAPVGDASEGKSLYDEDYYWSKKNMMANMRGLGQIASMKYKKFSDFVREFCNGELCKK